MLMDIRHPLQEYDWQMIGWATQSAMPVHLLLTKADKLNNGPAKTVLLTVKRELTNAGFGDEVTVQTFSSLKKTGIEQLKLVIQSWLAD